MKPQYNTMHNTGNTASARNEASFHNYNNLQVSYHVAIDDKEAVQLIPFNRNTWHAGDGNGAGNRQSIGIEICYSMDNGYSGAKSARYKKAEDNAALYIAHVLKQYGWGIDRLKRHYDWSRKDCPHKMHATNSYQAFRRKVQRYLDQLNGKKVTKAKSKKSE
ncbi:peptidoglycan recognition protein family protein [Nosocomiicoccus ampullae]|uniref:N-acetylmuramoyl-L-alanine amidase n=1 Tax=Nosocomiicoccus ampullae TaxID=489910 RepID=A0A9Q2CXX4_9STAP|nr:N-acetylmuramoyl-L-alanine amidase [Nosocomiicoccus ampullae]MBB5175263.1 N-acetylmuramoyl-L-alanine amidase CwlA [Nosocomiicoccus ampullae]QYA46361.1 N-acetylmuramoyl-L-alanine amidase [Nosocomiicoccus ampullae]